MKKSNERREPSSRGNAPRPQSTPAASDSLITGAASEKAIEVLSEAIPRSLLNVAVIGDVMTDWAFISKEPARARFPVFKPWTRDPATHLFALPAGAWLSGHMIQGALSAPVFERMHSVKIKQAIAGRQTHIVLRGAISNFSPATLDIHFTKDPSHTFDVIINDEMVIDSRSISKMVVLLEKGSRSPNIDAEVGLTDAVLKVQNEYSSSPGFFNVDQVGRCFEAENVDIDIDQDKSLCCTFLTLTHAVLGLTLSHESDEPSRDLPTTILSLRIVPKDFRRGSIGTPGRFTIQANKPTIVHIKKASVGVTFGKLEATTFLQDNGKFNSPLAANYTTGPLNSQRHLTISLVGMNCPRCLRLWIYASPGDAISMQHPGHVVHALSQIAKFKRFADQKYPLNVYRRKENHGIDGPQHGYPTILDDYHHTDVYTFLDEAACFERTTSIDWKNSKRQLVCIDDEGLGFSRRCDIWAPFLWPTGMFSARVPETFDEFLAAVELTKNSEEVAKHIENTWFIIKLSHWIDSSRFDLLKYLENFGALDRTIVVVSGESLRRGLADSAEKPGIKLAKNVSWERTIEDFERARELGKLGDLGKCKHIVVRLGLEGGLHFCRQPEGKDEPLLQLCFDPERIEGEYAENSELGEVPGLTTVIMSVLAREFANYLQTETLDDEAANSVIDKAMSTGLGAARRYFDMGYGPTPETVRKIERLQLPISQVFSRARVRSLRNEGRHRFVSCVVRPSLDENSWSILNRYIEGGNTDWPKYDSSTEKAFGKASKLLRDSDHERALIRAIRSVSLARDIVLRGASRVFDATPQAFPFAKIGQLLCVDRHEMQGLRSIKTLLSEYIRHKERKVPISVAVFGPPGSGKSFGVKQIARGVTQKRTREFVFNLAQFSTFDELTRQLLKVRDSALDDEIPLVFFDEFDCSYGDRPLGWLKFFLSPMQDGKFQHEESMLSIGKAIFVFAGGIASRHMDFADPEFWKERVGGQSRDDLFTTAKGPDFHSRLRGYLDILGPNPSLLRCDPKSDDNAKKKFDRFSTEDFTFVIRRAILIRQSIESLHRESSLQLLDSEDSVEIDRDLLDALLLTDTYRHGVRSMQAIFEMSSIQGERALSKTALPSKAQFSMHVDKTFFNILIRDYIAIDSGILHGLFTYFAAASDFPRRNRREVK